MNIKNEENEILITLIRNSCNQLIDWAIKNDYDKVEWLGNIVRKDSDDIYNHLLSLGKSDKDYDDNHKKLEKIYSFIGNFMRDLEDNMKKPLDVILWNYFQCITKERELKKFEINENYEIKGHRVSDYGIKHDRLDYETLQKLVGNTVWNSEVPYRFDPWEFIKKPQNFNDWGDAEIDAWYIIDEDGARLLENFTDELLIFNPELEMYVWAWINRDFNEHPDLGVPNDKTLTNIKLSGMKKI